MTPVCDLSCKQVDHVPPHYWHALTTRGHNTYKQGKDKANIYIKKQFQVRSFIICLVFIIIKTAYLLSLPLAWLCVMVWYLLQFIFTLNLWLKILSNIGEGSHEFANFMPIFCTGQWTLCYGGWQSLKLVQITRLRLQCICQFAFKLNFNFSLWQSVDLKTGHCRVLFCQKLGCSDITMNNTANIDSK